jgi:ACS family hexuronate transporter-like MFS transporter
MTLNWSWRGPFLTTGLIGLVVSALWFLVYRRPEVHPWVTPRERDHVRAGRIEEQGASSAAFTFKHVLKTRPFWAVAIGRFISDSTWMFYVLWLAKFLVDQHGMSIEDVGRYGWIPWAFANVGSAAGGWCSGLLIRRGVDTRAARLTVLAVCAGIRAFTFLLAIPMSTPLLLTLIGVLMMCTTSWQVNLSVMNVDNYPARLVSTVAGVTTSFGTLSSVFFQSIVAWFLLNYSYRPVLILISMLSVTAYIVVHLIVRHAPKPFTAELETARSAG